MQKGTLKNPFHRFKKTKKYNLELMSGKNVLVSSLKPKHDLRCAVATCDVRAEPILVVTCDVRAVHFQACEVRPQYCTFLAIMKELMIEIYFEI